MPVDKFKGCGLGTKKKTPPICVKFPPNIDAILRELPDRSESIRRWVLKGIEEEGLNNND